MSHIIRLYWAIVDQSGNSVDGAFYASEEAATAVMNTLLAADPALTLSVAKQEKILI